MIGMELMATGTGMELRTGMELGKRMRTGMGWRWEWGQRRTRAGGAPRGLEQLGTGGDSWRAGHCLGSHWDSSKPQLFL